MSEKYESKEIVINMLRMASDNIAIRFLSPIYLVGSYIDFPETALDIDILMVVTKQRYFRLFECASPGFNKRQFEFRRKQKIYYEEYFSGMDIDFKVTDIERFIKCKDKKVKLDSYMEFPE